MDKPQSKSSEIDAEKLLQQMEVELAIKRDFQASRSDNQVSRRILALVFVLLVVFGLLGGMYYYAVSLAAKAPTHEVTRP